MVKNPVVGNQLRLHCDAFQGYAVLRGKEFTSLLRAPSVLESYVSGNLKSINLLILYL